MYRKRADIPIKYKDYSLRLTHVIKRMVRIVTKWYIKIK